MKSTGITRRIDDLGRIVIPKEIRKNLRIRENEVLEIFIEVLEDITLNNILITNREKIVATSKRKEYDYLNKDIGQIVIDVIEKKDSILSKGNIEIIENKKIDTNYYIKPIINSGDTIGSIIIFGSKEL